jgi:hypothetical protein
MRSLATSLNDRRVLLAANKKEAAGDPAAQATGRHHNVREDIGWA